MKIITRVYVKQRIDGKGVNDPYEFVSDEGAKQSDSWLRIVSINSDKPTMINIPNNEILLVEESPMDDKK